MRALVPQWLPRAPAGRLLRNRTRANLPLGRRISTPRGLSVATLCWVAACCHIFPFIAGASRIFAVGCNASAMHVSASSAIPCASLAITLAVAGAMRSKSAFVRQFDVRWLPAFLFIIKVRHHRMTRHCLEGQRSDETQRIGGHDDVDIESILGQQARRYRRPCAPRWSRSRPARCFFLSSFVILL